MARDDLGTEVALATPTRRVVSLVPSLTETVAASAPDLLVGATDYCTHPASLDVPRVGGSKYPDVGSVLALKPDLVLANAEENRPEDVAAIRAAGVDVWVTFPRTVNEAFGSLARMLEALRLGEPSWLADAREVWAAPAEFDRSVVVPVWRRPWVVLGGDTFASNLLLRLGLRNVYASAAERYPRPRQSDILPADLVLLPDEPYAFTADDGPEAFPGRPHALVSGRHLTWYGPSLTEARQVLTWQLRSTG
jgi:ABC-type Fe3+-hydroxamate transport system substrate-binding protein